MKADCVHHWAIETASGKTSTGCCRNCGAYKEFNNSLPEMTFFLNAEGRAEINRRANVVLDVEKVIDAARAND